MSSDQTPAPTAFSRRTAVKAIALGAGATWAAPAISGLGSAAFAGPTGSAAPAGGGGQPLTLGSTFEPQNICGGEFDIAQTASGTGPQYTVPAAGTIRSFATGAGDGGQAIVFAVFRPLGGDSFLVVGQSPAVTPPEGGMSYPLATPITVRAGDVLGLRTVGNRGCANFMGDGTNVVRLGNNGSAGSTVTLPGEISGLNVNISAIFQPAV